MAATGTVCIVGAGAAGLSLASYLAAHPCRVILVEAGAVEPARELEDTYRVTAVGTPHRGVHEGRFRAWGGSTTRWGGQLWPWEPHEFEARPELDIDGWPIGYEEIAPWYDAAFRLLGLPRGSLTEVEARARGVQPSGLDASEFALKYSTWLPWRLRNLGQRVGGAVRRGARIAVHHQTTMVGFVPGPTPDRVAGVRVRRADGTDATILADVIVLAAGAVETARLLLASGNGREAIGNESGWVGRAFMDHLSVRVARFHPRDPTAFGRMFAPLFVRGVQYTPRMVLLRRALERERLLSAYGHWDVAPSESSALHVVREKLRALQAGRLRVTGADLRRLASGARDVYELARGLLVDQRRWFPRDAAIHLRVDTEQRPDPESRIFITDDRDEYGLPRVSLDWRISELERHTVRRTADLLGTELERAGIGALEPPGNIFDPQRPWGDLRGDSYHMMGGTRMAKAADDGVVDTNAKVFGTENVYVAGASIFPTGGMANPTLTLIALALRLGDHLGSANVRAA